MISLWTTAPQIWGCAGAFCEPVRIVLKMSPALITKIDDFRYEHRIPSRNAAIRALIELGLKHSNKPKPKS